MSDVGDYFSLYGYRALALAMIEQALVDLLQTRDPNLSQSALSWIEEDQPDRTASRGLTFNDCIEAAGASSARDVFRQRCRSEPSALREDLRRLSSALQCERKAIRNAAMSAIAAEEEQGPTFDTRVLPPTHILHGDADSHAVPVRYS